MESQDGARAAGASRPVVAAPKRSASIDGLRALAILPVMLYHAQATSFPGGTLGVDVFFVLSGFLITGLLVDEFRSSGDVWLGGFYGRRALRILPSLLAMVAAVFVVRTLVQHQEPVAGAATFLTPLSFLHNWVMIGGNYSSDMGPTWSLAIEEQFYLLWPLFLLVLLRRRTALRTIVIVTLVLAAASFAWQVWLSFADPVIERAYLGSDTRAHGLLFGAAFALWCRTPAFERYRPALARFAPPLALAFLVLFPALVLGSDEPTSMHGLNVLCTVGTLAIVACALVTPTGGVSRTLAWRPLVAIGIISYTLYLWHNIIRRLLQEQLIGTSLWGWPAVVIVMLVPIPVAFLVHRFVEKPALRRRYRFDWRRRAPQPASSPTTGLPIGQ